MTFVWLTPLIVLVSFLTVILFQAGIQEKSSTSEKNLQPNTLKSGEPDVSKNKAR